MKRILSVTTILTLIFLSPNTFAKEKNHEDENEERHEEKEVKRVKHLKQLSCAENEIARFNGNTWECSSDDGSDTLGQLKCAMNEIARFNGIAWKCSLDQGSDTLGELSCNTSQIAEFDGDVWVCADKPSGNAGPGLALFDSSVPPKKIGNVITISRSGVRTVLVSVQITLLDDTTKNVALTFSSNGINNPSNSSPLYESTDCSDPPLIVNAEMGVFDPSNVYTTQNISGSDTSFSFPTALYVGTTNVPATFLIKSRVSAGGICDTYSPGVSRSNLVPAEEVYPDFYDTFPRPYTIVAE